MQKKVNIIILNYNGRVLLEECLPSIVTAAETSKHQCRVTLLDNQSADDSIAYARALFPSIEIVRAPSNRFLVSYNELAGKIGDDIMILLNNDIKLDKGFVDPIVRVFIEHEDAFMAGPKCWTFDMKRYEGSRTKIRFYFGHMQAFTRYPGYDRDIDFFGYSASVGSVVAFDRKKFLELGGYDDLYLPGRLEDLDLCYRGWKRGWKGYYQPESLAFHKSSAAFKKNFGERKTVIMAYKNTFLFTWKNISDGGLIFQHCLFLLPRLIYSIVTFEFRFCIGFFQAIPEIFEALRRRGLEKKSALLSDKEIFNYVGF